MKRSRNLASAARLALRLLLAPAAAAALVTGAHAAVRDTETELAGAAARGRLARGGARRRALDVLADRALDFAPCSLALRDAARCVLVDLLHRCGALGFALRGGGADDREVDAAAHDGDVLDLDLDFVAELDRLARLLAREAHVDRVVLERLVAEGLELDETFDEGLLDLDEGAEA